MGKPGPPDAQPMAGGVKLPLIIPGRRPEAQLLEEDFGAFIAFLQKKAGGGVIRLHAFCQGEALLMLS